MTVLADTSIWIDFFRSGKGRAADRLARLLREETVVVCGPVVAELLAGTPPERRDDLALALGGLGWVDVDRTAWHEAGELAYSLRAEGRSVPLMDLVIAVASVRAQASLWTRDADFQRIETVLPAMRLYREP